MTMRFVIDPSWTQRFAAEKDEVLGKLGDQILPDMKRNCPVDTGRLQTSLDSQVEDGILRVGSRDVEYSVDVELGTSDKPAQPYMRPALFQQRRL